MVVQVAELEWGDYITIAVYFVVVLIVGLWTEAVLQGDTEWSTFRPNRGTSAGYFLAGKDMTWFPIGASIFASNVGAPMFIGLAGSAAASGFAVAIYEWHAIYLLIALGWVFVPVYVASGSFTMPEYLKRRFGGKRLRIYLSFLALVLYVLTKISSEIYSGAIFLQQILGWNIYLAVLLILAVTAVYTIAGGLAAVIYTDTLQTIILLIGSFILMVKGFVRMEGWQNMQRLYMKAAANYTLADPVKYSCGLPRHDSFHVWRDATSGDLPWPGAAVGLTIVGMWVWCNDQVMVQRCLSGKNLSHAKGGTVLAAGLKILPFFVFIIPGMISRILFPNEVACADPDECMKFCENPAGCTNIAYPLLVLRIMPAGLRGVMLAALLAALMSSLTSIFNSASTMLTMDLWRRFRPQAKERELMVVGRLCVLVLVGLSILWIPILQASQGGQLWSYLQAISAYVAPPWTIVFLMAVFWNRTTEAGAFWGLMGGLAIGVARMAIDFAYPAPLCGSGEPDTRPDILSKVHFFHFAIILSFLTAVIIVVVSLMTEPRSPEKLRRVTWWTRNQKVDYAEESDSEAEEDDDEEELPTKVPKKKSVGKIMYNWLCGVTDEVKPKLTRAQKALIREKMTDIKEDPYWSKVLNITAIVVSAITAFLLGFFG